MLAGGGRITCVAATATPDWQARCAGDAKSSAIFQDEQFLLPVPSALCAGQTVFVFAAEKVLDEKNSHVLLVTQRLAGGLPIITAAVAATWVK